MEGRFPMLRMRLQSGLPSRPGGLKKERECMQSAKEKRQKQLEALEYVERFRGTIWDAIMRCCTIPIWRRCVSGDGFALSAVLLLRGYLDGGVRQALSERDRQECGADGLQAPSQDRPLAGKTFRPICRTMHPAWRISSSTGRRCGSRRS